MLNSWDLQFMKDSVREVIGQWGDSITVLSPLPIDQQPNYNKLMHEFTGEIKFNNITIPAEHRDIVNNNTNDIDVNSVDYGEKDEGAILYSIPDVIPVYDASGVQVGTQKYKPGVYDIITIDNSNDRYFIKSMRDRIGEVLILLYRFTGGTPNGIGTLEQYITQQIGGGSP
jgi:hypothetical protein